MDCLAHDRQYDQGQLDENREPYNQDLLMDFSVVQNKCFVQNEDCEVASKLVDDQISSTHWNDIITKQCSVHQEEDVGYNRECRNYYPGQPQQHFNRDIITASPRTMQDEEHTYRETRDQLEYTNITVYDLLILLLCNYINSVSGNSVCENENQRNPDRYDGTTDLDDFVQHFESVAKWNNWNEEDKVLHLKMSLRGAAYRVLYGFWEKHDSYEAILERLKQQFDHGYRSFALQSEFWNRERESGETLIEFAQCISKMADKAFATTMPDRQSRQPVLIHRFLSGIGDFDMGRWVFMQNPQSLDEALNIALEYNSYEEFQDSDGKYKAREANSRQGDRTVNSDGNCREVCFDPFEYHDSEVARFNEFTNDWLPMLDNMVLELDELALRIDILESNQLSSPFDDIGNQMADIPEKPYATCRFLVPNKVTPQDPDNEHYCQTALICTTFPEKFAQKRCYECKEVGHIRPLCPARIKKRQSTVKSAGALSDNEFQNFGPKTCVNLEQRFNIMEHVHDSDSATHGADFYKAELKGLAVATYRDALQSEVSSHQMDGHRATSRRNL